MIDPTASELHMPTARRGRAASRALSAAVCVGLLAVGLAALYLVRTPMVTGQLVAGRLAALARRHHINLKVGSYRPHGLVGVRFEQVQVSARHGAFLVQADLDHVDVTPSLGNLVSTHQLQPSAVAIHGGQVLITRLTTPSAHPLIRSKGAKSRAKGATPRAKGAKPRAKGATPMVASLHDVSVMIRPDPLPGMTRPLVLHRAAFEIGSVGRRSVTFRSGYGVFPDGTAFAAHPVAGSSPAAYVIEPQGPTRLDEWVDMPVPVKASVDTIRICPDCAPATIELERVRVGGVRQMIARSQKLSLSTGGQEVRVDLAPVTLRRAEHPVPYSLHNFEAVYDAEAKTTIVQGDVDDGHKGQASFASNWSDQWGVLETNIQLHGFHTTKLWPLVGLGAHVDGGMHSGKIDASYEPRLDLIEFSLDMDTRDLSLALPVVTADPLDFAHLGLKLDATFQPRARTLSISSGEAFLGDAGPVHFGGYAIDAGSGLVFDTFARAHHLHPQRLRDGVPPTLAKIARGTQFSGEFGFDITSAGNTAFPDSISLGVDFTGHVDVGGDSSYADVLALASDGPPSIDLPGTLAQKVATDEWVAYDSLPKDVPLVLTAAEDAKFFKHDGFDWSGLRRALVYDVKEGGIERGGSTLSQQLSKNLFLDTDRTLARKLQEAYVTWRLESELSKKRILELYMNMVQWGPNIQGLRQAARRYFHTEPEHLTIAETCLLAAVLPGPSLYGEPVLSGYLPSSRIEKIAHILNNLRFLHIITRHQYSDIYAHALQGDVGPLELTVCDDDGKAPDGAPRCP